MERYRVVCATGDNNINGDLQRFESIDVVAICHLKSDIPIAIKEKNPDVLLVTDKIQGEESLLHLIHDLKVEYRDTLRIVYFAGALKDWDSERKYQLANLAAVGIYDIDTSEQFDPYTIKDLIENPRSSAVQSKFLEKLYNQKSETRNAAVGYTYVGLQEMDKKKKESEIPCIVFSAAKPGTGKSTAAISTAVCIAKYGLNNPRVALIDGDMQTLSVGNFLGLMPDEKHNIKIAMQNISELVNGQYDTKEKELKAQKNIRNCFIKYRKIPNLHVLCGSQISPIEIDKLRIRANYFDYLVNLIKDDYDVIIVDLNSSLYQASSYSLLTRCKSCYFVINMDYNNVQNNTRYKELIDSFGTAGKIRYILNKTIENTKAFRWAGFDMEELYFTAEKIDKEYFPLAVKIPAVPETVYNNAQYEGVPLALYRKAYTRKVRLALMEIANEIWPLDDTIERLRKQVEADEKEGFLDGIFKKKKKEDVQITAAEQMTSMISRLKDLSDQDLIELKGSVENELDKRNKTEQ